MTTFAQFLDQNVDGIVDDFEAFARTSGPSASQLSTADLRDHAKIVLQAVAADMATHESDSEQRDKAAGQAQTSDISRVRETSRKHAQHRFEQAFTLPQMLSEYRALRASVIRRWTAQLGVADTRQLAELTRFGEAIDEGLTEAIAWYSGHLEQSRNMLIGVLAHDLRGPLGAVTNAASYLLRAGRLQREDLQAATRIASSSKRMAGYISDLLDFAQTLLGGGLPISRRAIELTSLFADVLDEVRAAHPTVDVRLMTPDALHGRWDPGRLAQMLSNLVVNAIIHGDANRPVTVTVHAADEAHITVHNFGDAIPPDVLINLFTPLRHHEQASRMRPGSSGLGLGLYISREIAAAHRGTLEAKSDASTGTTFEVRLPRD
jgi:signal transduction histidine kinase